MQGLLFSFSQVFMSHSLQSLQRQAMIDCQLRPNQVTNPAILSAFSTVKRELYLPQECAAKAYSDNEIKIADQRYTMEPRVFARMLEAAELRSDDMTVVFSCATGYFLAVLNEIVAAVVGVEQDQNLAQQAAKALGRSAVVFDSPSQASAFGPFSLVMIDGAVEDVEQLKQDALQAGLAVEARILLVERCPKQPKGQALRLDWKNGVWTSQKLFDASSSPLPYYSKPQSFQF